MSRSRVVIATCACAAIGIGVLFFGFSRQNHAGSRLPPTHIVQSDRTEGPEAAEVVASNQLPQALNVVTATAQPKTEDPRKPYRDGLVDGDLPTPDYLRSSPDLHVSPAVKADLEARASRASMLNQRLETRIDALKAQAKHSSAAERQRMEHDIGILQAQYDARKSWESPNRLPTR